MSTRRLRFQSRRFSPRRLRGLIVFVAAALFLSVGIAGILKVTVDILLRRDAVSAAENWARYVADNVTDIDEIAAGAQISSESMDFFIRSQQIRQVFRFEVIDLNGNVRLSSDGVKIIDVGGKVHNDAAARAARTGEPIFAVREGKPPVWPLYYSEAYLPVVIDGKLQAIVAAYVNLDEQHDRFRDAFLLALSGVCLLSCTALSIPFVAWYRRAKEKRRAEQRIQYLAFHDVLTELPNRTQFADRAADALDRLSRTGETFSILLLDLDRFKYVNDTLGHPVGDSLLKAVAGRLQGCARRIDTVARLGGDEFGILQACTSTEQDAVALATRIREAITRPYMLDGSQVMIGTSIGIAFAPAHGTQFDRLLKCADISLYEAKYGGRNRHCIFHPALEEKARARVAMEVDLRRAVERHEFVLHYQVVTDIASGRPAGAEALIRWPHPQAGVVPQDRFIPAAEELDLMAAIGTWVLRTACADARDWPAGTTVAVNFSPAQFTADLVGIVAAALADSGLPPQRLEFEITESILLRDNARNLAILRQLKAMGVSIVLDDFGTGYSSLSYIKTFPFDKIKIDRSFVNDIEERADCAAIVDAVIGLARRLGIATTAEGVENESQLQLLRQAGCTYAQGYLLGRPVPKAQLALARAEAIPAAF